MDAGECCWMEMDPFLHGMERSESWHYREWTVGKGVQSREDSPGSDLVPRWNRKHREAGEQRLFPSKNTSKSKPVKVRLRSSGLAASRVVQGEPGRCPEHKQDSRANRSP